MNALASITSGRLDIADLPDHAHPALTALAIAAVIVAIFAASVFCGECADIIRREWTRPHPISEELRLSKASYVWSAVVAALVLAVSGPLAVITTAKTISANIEASQERPAVLSKAFPGVRMSDDERDCIYDLAGGHYISGDVCRVENLRGSELTTRTFHRAGKYIVSTTQTQDV